MRQPIDLGLGRHCGNHPVAGPIGAVLQMFRRLGLALAALIVVLQVVNKPPNALFKTTVTLAVVLVAYGLRLAWRLLSARFGLSRCYLYTGGLVITNLLGGVRDAVAWSDVTTLNRSAGFAAGATFNRFVLSRNGRPPVTFLALGLTPALAKELPDRAARNGIV
ncbi:hypothetical protein [Streptomyces acidiscabies]|uniref:Uncharacterized protein n=1 Tax=Streptomyces acidiscabies TaxID=42234 RepID=A0AAP6EFA7_9ACTN|nr:hypothetical protein [Streptomyces acidiscabies]MBP5937128.1 hypothetical protein [Streptomyces sp. LBUM 1476]MBZ3914825.1 hypothetical protein [Streptomyces acidiscabies]MDX2960723.1 hypothetical protein [Streptomyces acidiscabies]MDX3020741.1 hypothetical protein [Streptomyces acidiscabies]MDX3792888.1 hypothetical protein [Streptomyces acidiscabies]